MTFSGSTSTADWPTFLCFTRIFAVSHGEIFPPIGSHAFDILVPVRLLHIVVVIILAEFRGAFSLLIGSPVPILDQGPQTMSGTARLSGGPSRKLETYSFGATSGR